MSTYRVIIADDEPAAREGLAALIGNDTELEVVSICSNGIEAIQAIEAKKPDLVLLDIQMPEVTGFDVLKALTPPLPVVIFITAYDEFAVRAFEHHALDYLMKPFSDKRFFESLNRAKASLRQQQVNTLSNQLLALLGTQAPGDDKVFNTAKAGTPQKLVVKTGGKVLLIPYSDIAYIEADDYVVNIHYQQKKTVIRESMKKLETLLPPVFKRTHKSFIVNTDYITEVETDIGGGLLLKLRDTPSHIPVSKSFREEISNQLGMP